MEINYHKYPLPRARHHTHSQIYIPYHELHLIPSGYPPLRPTMDWTECFANSNAPQVLDIGCGWGKFLMDFAELHPTHNVLGLEARVNAVTWINGVIEGEKLPNAHALFYSVVNLIPFIANESISHIFYFFPDPWFKKRHNKRRAFNQKMLQECHRVLQPNGILYLMTDVPEVDEYQCGLLEQSGLFTHRLVTNESEWFPIKTDQELFSIEKGIPYVRRLCAKV